MTSQRDRLCTFDETGIPPMFAHYAAPAMWLMVSLVGAVVMLSGHRHAQIRLRPPQYGLRPRLGPDRPRTEPARGGGRCSPAVLIAAPSVIYCWVTA